MSIIEMRDVVKKYDNGTTALRGVSVTIEPGEFAYIVGPSGAWSSQSLKPLTLSGTTSLKANVIDLNCRAYHNPSRLAIEPS